MKSASCLLIALLTLGCGANIYRTKPTASDGCDSPIATNCSQAPTDPNRFKLCGSAFANQSDFDVAARKYCPKPVLQNCALQCCDVDCSGTAAVAEAAAAPAAPAAPAQATAAPAASAVPAAGAPPPAARPAATPDEIAVPAPPPPPPAPAAPTPK